MHVLWFECLCGRPTLFTLMPAVAGHALAAEGAPFAVATAPGATGGKAHAHAAAVRHQAARATAGGISWRAQIVQLGRETQV